MDASGRTFLVESCLGRGGFGEVYRAVMTGTTGLSSDVALKVLRRDLSPGGQAVERLRDEGALLARLNHPTILRVYDLVVLEGRVALVTELVDGDDLERCLRGSDRIGIRALCDVICQVASALDAAYNAPVASGGGPLRLVHRDIKPSNIRIGKHGAVKLLDFGIARSDEVTREARTQTDMMVGSPPYMAPERFLSSEPIPASDIFALGAIAVEALLRARVFEVAVPVLASFAVDPTRYEAYLGDRWAAMPADVPADFVALCRRMLAYDPDARPGASEVARACEGLIDSLPGPTLSRWCRDRSWPTGRREVGDLEGRVLSEGTLARPWPTESTTAPRTRDAGSAAVTTPLSAIAPAERRRGRWWLGWLLGAGGVASMFAVGTVAAALLGGGAWWLGVNWSVPVRPVPERVEPPIPDLAAPISEPVAPPEPVSEEGPPGDPQPEPVRPDPAKRRVEPEPEPLEPEPPEPEPPAPPVQEAPVIEVSVPEPAPEPTRRVVQLDVEGEALSVVLLGPGGAISLPSTVSPGSYRVRATFRTGDPIEQPLEVSDAARQIVRCSLRLGGCRAQPAP